MCVPIRIYVVIEDQYDNVEIAKLVKYLNFSNIYIFCTDKHVHINTKIIIHDFQFDEYKTMTFKTLFFFISIWHKIVDFLKNIT